MSAHSETVIQIVKPKAMFEVVHDRALEALAGEADERLKRALEHA